MVSPTRTSAHSRTKRDPADSHTPSRSTTFTRRRATSGPPSAAPHFSGIQSDGSPTRGRPSNVIIAIPPAGPAIMSDLGSQTNNASRAAAAAGFTFFLSNPSSSSPSPDKLVVELPLNPLTVSALIAFTALSLLGAVYLYKLLHQHACACPLCKGEYVIEEKIGSGGFGSVYSCLQKGGGAGGHPIRLVLKNIPVSDINDATEAQREAKDLRYLKHPRIVRYVNDFLHSTPAGTTADTSLYVCIVMEWCKYDLRRYIQRTRRKGIPIPEALVCKWTSQLVSALKYCHSKGVCHRDIKSQNVFITDGNDVRLGDFGLARAFNKPHTNFTPAGTDVYKSPEAILGGKRDGRKADIWALGLVLLEMVTQKFVWEREGSLGAQALSKDTKPLNEALAAIPVLYSAPLRLLVKRCLTVDAQVRPSAEELFRFRLLRRALSSAGSRAAAAASSSVALTAGSGGQQSKQQQRLSLDSDDEYDDEVVDDVVDAEHMFDDDARPVSATAPTHSASPLSSSSSADWKPSGAAAAAIAAAASGAIGASAGIKAYAAAAKSKQLQSSPRNNRRNVAAAGAELQHVSPRGNASGSGAGGVDSPPRTRLTWDAASEDADASGSASAGDVDGWQQAGRRRTRQRRRVPPLAPPPQHTHQVQQVKHPRLAGIALLKPSASAEHPSSNGSSNVGAGVPPLHLAVGSTATTTTTAASLGGGGGGGTRPSPSVIISHSSSTDTDESMEAAVSSSSVPLLPTVVVVTAAPAVAFSHATSSSVSAMSGYNGPIARPRTARSSRGDSSVDAEVLAVAAARTSAEEQQQPASLLGGGSLTSSTPTSSPPMKRFSRLNSPRLDHLPDAIHERRVAGASDDDRDSDRSGVRSTAHSTSSSSDGGGGRSSSRRGVDS